jgi:hypothetical protein
MVQLRGMSGDTGPHEATFRKCLLGSRSRVRVAVGAQARCYPSSISEANQIKESQMGSQRMQTPGCQARQRRAAVRPDPGQASRYWAEVIVAGPVPVVL